MKPNNGGLVLVLVLVYGRRTKRKRKRQRQRNEEMDGNSFALFCQALFSTLKRGTS